jgi:hypothetical protein
VRRAQPAFTVRPPRRGFPSTPKAVRMPGMFRRLFAILSALLLVLYVGVVAMWPDTVAVDQSKRALRFFFDVGRLRRERVPASADAVVAAPQNTPFRHRTYFAPQAGLPYWLPALLLASPAYRWLRSRRKHRTDSGSARRAATTSAPPPAAAWSAARLPQEQRRDRGGRRNSAASAGQRVKTRPSSPTAAAARWPTRKEAHVRRFRASKSTPSPHGGVAACYR